MPAATAIGVRAIIVEDDEIVVVEHNESRGQFLLLPGGGLEAGESIFEAVRREVLEETGLEVKPLALCYVCEIKSGPDYGIEFYIHCSVTGGELKLGADPEKTTQVLTRVARLPLVELAARSDWYPEELRGVLCDDARAGFPVCRYLGVRNLS